MSPLLLAYQVSSELQPIPGPRFGDAVDALGRPNANGVPDLLDEARWGLEWMLKLHPSPDALYHQVADDRTLDSLANPRILLDAPSMAALKKTFNRFGDGGPVLFDKTVEAIRTSLEAGLRYVFLIGAVTALVSFLLILLIPEVSIDAEVEDKKRPGRK